MARDGSKNGSYFQYSINEKVAYEMNPDIVKNGIRKILGLNIEDTSIPKPASRNNRRHNLPVCK